VKAFWSSSRIRMHTHWDLLFGAGNSLLRGDLSGTVNRICTQLFVEHKIFDNERNALPFLELVKVILGVAKKDSSEVLLNLPQISKFFALPHQVDALLQLSIVLLSDQRLTQSHLKDFGDAFEIDSSIVDGIVAISQKDFFRMFALAQRFGNYELKKVEMLVNLVENLRMLSPSCKDNKELPAVSRLSSAVQDGPVEGQHKESRIEKVLSELSYKDLFIMFDKDTSGDINFEEFLDLTKYLQLNLSDNQALKIFSQSAKADGFLDEDRFEEAMDILRTRISKKALSILGLSTSELLKMLLIRLLILLALFGFIFLGIAAFSQGTAFSSVINSILSVASALGVNISTATDIGDISEQKVKAKESVKVVFETIKRPT